MADHFLVISSDQAWLEAAQLMLEDSLDDDSPAKGLLPRVTTCPDDATALIELLRHYDDPITAAVIDGFHGQSSTPQDAALGYGARESIISLRAQNRSLPVLLVCPTRFDLLLRYVAGVDGVAIIDRVSITKINQALDAMHKVLPGTQPWAQVDVFVEVESIRVRVTLANGLVLADDTVPSDVLPFLEDVQKQYRPPWELYLHDRPGDPRLHDDWSTDFCRTGERLHHYLLRDATRKAIEKCLAHVTSMEDIHFRFVTDHVTYPDVPFEAMRDRARDKFFRAMSPLARRVPLRPSQSIVGGQSTLTALLEKNHLTGRVLVIQSATKSGNLKVGKHRFRHQEVYSFRRLPDLDTETQHIVDARIHMHLDPPEQCVLRDGDNSVQKLEAAIGTGPWDIVHYLGHSARADDDEVFLVLPGDESGDLKGLSIDRFAEIIRKGRVSLLVLSSCEGTSSHSIFRLASEGVPATVGFRWEVLSSDATTFSARLHERLASGTPLGRAYLEALRVLTPDSPAFFSAMLVVQHDAWAHI